LLSTSEELLFKWHYINLWLQSYTWCYINLWLQLQSYELVLYKFLNTIRIIILRSWTAIQGHLHHRNLGANPRQIQEIERSFSVYHQKQRKGRGGGEDVGEEKFLQWLGEGVDAPAAIKCHLEHKGWFSDYHTNHSLQQWGPYIIWCRHDKLTTIITLLWFLGLLTPKVKEK